MKKVLLVLLGVIVVLGLFAASGFAGYRLGYAQAARATANGEVPRPQVGPFRDFGPRGMVPHGFGMERRFGPDGLRMRGFGFFSPFEFLGRLAVLALVIGFLYWLFARSGWRLTREPAPARPPAESHPPKTENE